MAKESMDTLIFGGTLLPMDEAGSILEDGGLAITGDRIIAVDFSHRLRERYTAERTIDARRTAIIPGLVDTYGHAGHGLIRGLYHPIHGWPAGHLYWHTTTDRWWYAEAQLAAIERLGFGVTTGASIIGSTPARTDSPIFAIRNAEAYSRVGIRAVLGVGPPDRFIPYIPTPWSGSHFEKGQWVDKTFTHEDAIANSLEVIEKWHSHLLANSVEVTQPPQGGLLPEDENYALQGPRGLRRGDPGVAEEALRPLNPGIGDK